LEHLIRRKSLKLLPPYVGLRILRLKCTKIDFSLAPPQTLLWGLLRSPDLVLAGIKGTYTSKKKGTVKGGEEKEREGHAGNERGVEETDVYIFKYSL